MSGNFTTMSRAAEETAPQRMFELIRICWMARPVQKPMGTLVFSLEITVGLLRMRTVPCLYKNVAFGPISGIMQGISSPLTWRLRESVILCLPMSIPATDKRESWASFQSMADHTYLSHILTAENSEAELTKASTRSIIWHLTTSEKHQCLVVLTTEQATWEPAGCCVPPQASYAALFFARADFVDAWRDERPNTPVERP